MHANKPQTAKDTPLIQVRTTHWLLPTETSPMGTSVAPLWHFSSSRGGGFCWQKPMRGSDLYQGCAWKSEMPLAHIVTLQMGAL